MKTLAATTVIRQALYDLGAPMGYVFTNLYDTCRTVKAYRVHVSLTDTALGEKLDALAVRIPGLTYKLNGSLIVRIPLDAPRVAV